VRAKGAGLRGRRTWVVLGVGALVLLLVAGFLLIPRLDPSGPSADAPSSPTPVGPPPEAGRIDAPGYEADPGPFSPASADDAAGEAITVSLTGGGPAVSTGGAVGLSFEATDLASPLWDSPESNIDETLAALDKPVLRFGGNSVDRRMWWTSSEEPAPDWAEATVTPEDLERVATVAEEADASVTLTVDLGHEDPDRAADMASQAREIFGDRLIGVAIGNEPNGFRHPNQPDLTIRDKGWDTDNYQEQLESYADAIEKGAPGTPIIGPDAYDAPWLRAFAEADVPDQEALSMHWYPLWDCTGPDSSIANPTLEDLTSPKLRAQERKLLGIGADVAAEHDLPLWLEETGPTSCEGTNETSRTHAQALWTVDHTLTAYESGAERVAFHSTLGACRGGAPMSPVCATGTYADPGQILQGRGSYLALLQLGQIPHGKILTSTVSGDGTVMVHATLAKNGRLALMIVDLRDPAATDADPVAVKVSAPQEIGDVVTGDAPSAWTPVTGSRLSGESLESQQSTLGAQAPVDATFGTKELARGEPLTVVSEPGTSTLLILEPGDGAAEE
jgi:hypothetical protein